MNRNESDLICNLSLIACLRQRLRQHRRAEEREKVLQNLGLALLTLFTEKWEKSKTENGRFGKELIRD